MDTLGFPAAPNLRGQVIWSAISHAGTQGEGHQDSFQVCNLSPSKFSIQRTL